MSTSDRSGDLVGPSAPSEPVMDREVLERFKSDRPHEDDPPIDDASERADLTTLDPAVIKLWREHAIIGLAVGLVVSGVAYLLLGAVAPGWRWLAMVSVGLVSVGVAAYAVAIPVRYRQWRWSLDEERLFVSEGVVIHSTMLVPRNRIQNVTTEAGPLQRRHGLSSLTVHTAGMRTPNVEIPALSDDVARRIRTELGHV